MHNFTVILCLSSSKIIDSLRNYYEFPQNSNHTDHCDHQSDELFWEELLSSSISLRMFMRMLVIATFYLRSSSMSLRPDSVNSRDEVIGDRFSSFTDTSRRVLSYFWQSWMASGVPSCAMLFRMKHASCACFSQFPQPQDRIAKSLSINLKFPRQQPLTFSDLSVRIAKIYSMDSRISAEEYTSNLAKQSILLAMIPSQISSFCSIRERSKSMPVSISSYVSLSRYCSIIAKSSLKSSPTLVRLLKMSMTFLVISLSRCYSNTRISSSRRSDSSTACRFLWFIRRLRRALVRVLSPSRANRSLGGQLVEKQKWMASITKGYCENRKGASVLTLKRRRVLRAQMTSSLRLDWRAMMRCLTSGMTGQSLVRFMQFTGWFWSFFSQYFLSSLLREECMMSPSERSWKRLPIDPIMGQLSPFRIGLRCLPATSSGRSAESSFPKKNRCSQPRRYFWQWFLRVKEAEVQVEGRPNSSTISFQSLLWETVCPPPFLQTVRQSLKRLSSCPPICGILIWLMPLEAQYSPRCFLNLFSSSSYDKLIYILIEKQIL